MYSWGDGVKKENTSFIIIEYIIYMLCGGIYMSSFWICSECGSANIYPENQFCEVCNKEIDEEEKNRAIVILRADRYEDRKESLFQKHEKDKASNLYIYDNNIYTKTIYLSNTYKTIDEKNWIVGNKAFDLTNNKYVSLRHFRVDEGDETIKRRIRNRFKVLAPLQHQAISQTFELFMEPTHIWIAEEFIDCVSLDDLIQTVGIVKYEDALIISIQISELLKFLHENNFIHGNLNPKNIKITADNKIFVTGLFIPFSKSLFANFENYCVSPEQIKFENDAPSSDIYSVGALLYKMINGRYPNQKGNETLAFCKNARCGINIDLPIGLEQIVLHALEFCAEDRYETVEELLDDLKNLYSDRMKTFSFSTNDKLKKVDIKECSKKKNILNRLFKK